MIKSDKRNTTRVSLKSKAALKRSGVAIAGDVANLSLGGLYVSTPAKYDAGTPVEIILQLYGTQQELHIPLSGIIVRNDPGGMAVQFQQLELDSVVNLRNIIIYAHQGIDQYFKEQ